MRLDPERPVIASAAKQCMFLRECPPTRSQRRSCIPPFPRLATSADRARRIRRASGGGTLDCFAPLAMTVVGAVGLSTRHRRRRTPTARIFLSEIQNLCYPANHDRNAKSSRILPLGPQGKVRARPEPQKSLEMSILGPGSIVTPLKLDKAAKGIFGKAWRKRAEIWKSLPKKLGEQSPLSKRSIRKFGALQEGREIFLFANP
jgi:hypothetical protein